MTTSSTGGPTDRDLQPHHASMLAEARKASRKLERRQADVELVTRAALAGFRGPEWVEIVGELASYGWGVGFGWLRKGRMQGKCASAGRPCPTLHDHTRRPEWAESLATDLVIESIERFRDEVLIPGRWDPTRGASLKSFFVGQMLKRFANVYRRWYRSELHPSLMSEVMADTRPAGCSTEGTAVARVDIRRELDGLGELPLRVVEMTAEDRPRADIAAALGISLGTIDSILYRLRKAHVA